MTARIKASLSENELKRTTATNVPATIVNGKPMPSRRTGIEGDIAQIENLRNAPRYLPDNIYDAIENFSKSDWTTKLLGDDVKGRYADLKKAAADRCPRALGTVVKAPEVQYHHEVYTQYLWNMF